MLSCVQESVSSLRTQKGGTLQPSSRKLTRARSARARQVRAQAAITGFVFSPTHRGLAAIARGAATGALLQSQRPALLPLVSLQPGQGDAGS